MPETKQGFTLVELSIVMVIIGLIIGGVLVGRDLIKAAEIRAIYGEKEKIVTAVMTFKLKYNCLPGDCPNATDYFGTNPAGCPPPPGSPPTTKTCNGDGDGKIMESYEIWQHLSAAGLWPGLFRGTNNLAAGWDDVLPVIKNTDNYWYLEHTIAGTWAGYELYNSFGKQNILTSFKSNYGPPQLFTPAEMLAFDSKYDDGKPAFGNIQVLSDWSITGCTDPETSPAPTAVYDTTKTEKNCDAIFLNLGF